MYNLGRMQAVEYVSGNRFSNLIPYFLSLSCFESCISYSWQICDGINRLAKTRNGVQVYTKGDDSAFERLNKMYVVSKHPFSKQGVVNEIPTDIWLVNHGVECVSGVSISFQELSEIIVANHQLFLDVQEAVRRRREKVTKAT